MATTKIFSTDDNLKVLTARHLLDEANIETFVINKKDSSYPGILGGGIELYVAEEMAAEARLLLVKEGVLEE